MCIYEAQFLFDKTNQTTIFPNFILSKNSTCFGHFLCPSSGVIYCTFGDGIFLAGLMTVSSKVPDLAGKLSSDLQGIYHRRMYNR